MCIRMAKEASRSKVSTGLIIKIFICWTRLDILTALKVSIYLFEWLNHAPCSLSLSSWTRSRCNFFFSGLWHPHSRNTFKYSVLRSLHCGMACCCMSQSCKTLAHYFSSFLSQIFINGTCDRTWSLWRQHVSSLHQAHLSFHTLLFVLLESLINIILSILFKLWKKLHSSSKITIVRKYNVYMGYHKSFIIGFQSSSSWT